MKRTEYDAIRRKIEAKYRREREALEIIWSLANEGGEEPELPESPKAEAPAPSLASADEPETNGEVRRATSEIFSESPAKRTRIPVLQEVRNLTREIEGDIVQSDIKQMLSQKYPNAHVVASSVSGALSRLVDTGELELVSKGGGAASDPYIYRRVLPSTIVQESIADEESTLSG